VGDLNAKRGQIQEMTERGQAKVIHAMVPLASMLGLCHFLRSMTQGRANYSMELIIMLKYQKCGTGNN
jgi:elongation factor G